MTEKTMAQVRDRKIAPFWYAIVAFLVGALILYGYNLATGFTPDRVAISVFDFSIYWYGIIIAFGIALGAIVVADLVQKRGQELFLQRVPAPIRERNLSELELPDALLSTLQADGYHELGPVLLRLPFGPTSLGLNDEEHALLSKRLLAQPGIKRAWIEDAPWRQWNPEHLWNGLFWCLILAVIGARLYHVLTPSPSMAEVGINSPADYFRHPMELINVRRGGLGIYGGIGGGALGLLLYSYRYHLSALKWADIAVIGVALGQFVGRWGNFFNQELYGRPTALPWAVYIERDYRLSEYVQFSRFHPAFLYESLWNLLAFAILLTLWRRYRDRLIPGDLMATYLILYGVGRILMETVRLDSRTLTLGQLDVRLPVATVVSSLLAIIMLAWIVWRHRIRGSAGRAG